MKPIDKQVSLLNDITQIVHDEADQNYEKLECNFKVLGEEDEMTAIVTSFFMQADMKVNNTISGINLFKIVDLVTDLHKLMKAHTGGEWTAFTLFIEEDGSVRTKFEYPKSGAS